MLLSSLIVGKNGAIRQISRNNAEERGNYRFLNNPRVGESSLIEECTSRVGGMAEGRHVLAIQDTMEVNLESHSGRLKPGTGLGPTGNDRDVGFFLHPSLVLDAERLTPLGFSAIDMYHRDWDKGDRHSRGYKKLPIEEKESYKWIRSSEASKGNLSGARSITIIQDREGDIYDQFARVPDERTHLLIRANFDRKLDNSTEKLFGHLSGKEVMETYTVDIEGDERKKRKARGALMEIRYAPVEIRRPGTASRDCPKTVSAHIVEAKESGATVPEGEKPVHWRILTTHAVESPGMARLILDWYACRWFIEQVFRLMKKKGFRIEDTQLETGRAIRKLTVMLLQAVLRICQMMIAYGDGESQPTTDVFGTQEIECLERLGQKLEGRTDKLKNPYPRGRLSWATWVIARLGGWKGYRSQRPPGPITLKNGLDEFNSIFRGWILAN